MLKHAIGWTAILLAGAIGATSATVNAQDLPKLTFAVTTTNISVGHAAHSSIPVSAGFWKEDGLDVEVLGLGGATEGVQQVASGQIPFATVGPEALLAARSKGVPVVAIYTYARRPIYRIVALKDSGITKMEDLKGKTIGVPNMATGSVPFTRAALKTAGIDPAQDVKWLAVGLGAPAAHALRQKTVDAWGSWDTAVAAIENGGFQFNYIDPPWINDMFGNVLIASPDTLAKHPDYAVKIARGIAKSTIFGLTNPEATIRNHWKVYPQTKPQGNDPAKALKDAKHIFNSRFELLRLPQGVKFGQNVDSQWQRMAQMAIDEGLIAKDFDVKAAYTNKFIDEINKFDQQRIVEMAKKSSW
jgi:NitT/TauT family transport system substrate-binding protein